MNVESLLKRYKDFQVAFENTYLYSKEGTERACRYMHYRGITPQIRQRWGIGYNSSDTAVDEFVSLRNRLTFPIVDYRGRIVSFSGRLLRSGATTRAKYVGLPDTIVFQKSAELYGLNVANPHIISTGLAVVVEGYTDVIGMWEFSGIPNVVGSMGVASTVKQLTLLARWADRAIIVMDGDAAGRKAMDRLTSKLADVPLKVSFVYLPTGKDPFDMSKELGSGFSEYLSGQMRLASGRSVLVGG